MASGWSRRDLLRAGVGLVAVACAGGTASDTPVPSSPRSSTAAGRPDSPLAANALLNVWPDKIAKAPAEVREAYDYAVRAPKSLQYIPCYCGCGASGHKNNQDCYVQTFATNGWVVLDLHGYG
jgi:hypothetical protein